MLLQTGLHCYFIPLTNALHGLAVRGVQYNLKLCLFSSLFAKEASVANNNND
jgi:hypothetical protein